MMQFNKMSLADKYDHIVKTLKRFPLTFCYIIIATVYKGGKTRCVNTISGLT